MDLTYRRIAHDPNMVYHGSQFAEKITDRSMTRETSSSDLTTNSEHRAYRVVTRAARTEMQFVASAKWQESMSTVRAGQKADLAGAPNAIPRVPPRRMGTMPMGNSLEGDLGRFHQALRAKRVPPTVMWQNQCSSGFLPQISSLPSNFSPVSTFHA